MTRTESKVRLGRAASMTILGVSIILVAGVFAGEFSPVSGDNDAGAKVFGVVVGGDGTPLPGVRVSLAGGDVKQKSVTANDGAFRFVAIPPGDYRVVLQMAGKKKTKRKVSVESGDVDLGTIALK